MSTIPPVGVGFPPPVTAPSSAGRPRDATAAGSTSALWQVLTDEERAYFDAMSALGPVSYGPGGKSASPNAAPLGQRIDVTG